MEELVRAVILDDETVHINGQALKERSEITTILQKIIELNPGAILLIEPEKNAYFRAIGKVIYASQFAGFSLDNLRYRTEEGSIVTMAELKTQS